MKKHWKILTKILAILGWIVVVIIAAVFLGTNWVKDAANNVIDQIHQGQLESVYDASALAKEMSYADFAKNMWIGTDMSIETAELKWREGRGFKDSEKYIYGTFLFKNGEEQTLTFWFQKAEKEYILLGITGWTPE